MGPVLQPVRIAVPLGIAGEVLKRPRARPSSIQTALREWAYAQAYETSAHRADELPRWMHRCNWHRPHGSLNAQTSISRLGLADDNLMRLHIAINSIP